MRVATVEYKINDEVEKELDELLSLAKDYVSPSTGKKPYLSYDKDKLLQMVMEIGSTGYILELLGFMKVVFRKEV